MCWTWFSSEIYARENLMVQRILIVDDEERLLHAFRRNLRRQYIVESASSGQQAIDILERKESFAVIVSDMSMPGMNGADLLAQAKSLAPDTVRIMLTGNADQKTAMDAINRGDIFRFLTKPCSKEMFVSSVNAAIEQHQLLTTEKELLENTLQGTTKVLTDILSLVNPEAFGRTNRLTRLVNRMANCLQLADSWKYKTAAMLSQVGCVILPEGTIHRFYQGEQLSEEEEELWQQHACLGADLLAHIPRLEEVVEIIRYQSKCFDGTGIPRDGIKADAIPLGARLLKVAQDYDALDMAEMKSSEILEQMQSQETRYDPRVLIALIHCLDSEKRKPVIDVAVNEISEELVLAEDVKTLGGALVVCKGQETNTAICSRLRNFAQNRLIKSTIKVEVSRFVESENIKRIV